MISACLSLFDDRTALNKRLRDIAAGHFLKGVSSNQYFILTQAVLAALSTCIGEDDVAISSWKRIFTFFLRVMVPYARYLEGKCRISKALKAICGDFGHKKVVDSSSLPNPKEEIFHELSFQCPVESKGKKESANSIYSCPYHSDMVSRSVANKSKYSIESIDLERNEIRRRVRVNNLLQEKDSREDEPSNNDAFILRNHAWFLLHQMRYRWKCIFATISINYKI